MATTAGQPTLQTNQQNGECIAALVREGARFLIVGGFAVRAYCPGRDVMGADVDLLIDRAPANAAIVSRIVDQFDMTTGDPTGLTRPKAQRPAKRGLWMDVLTLTDGEDFDPLWNGATLATINGTQVRVVSVDALRRMKERAVQESQEIRDRHLADLKLLAGAQAGLMKDEGGPAGDQRDRTTTSGAIRLSVSGAESIPPADYTSDGRMTQRESRDAQTLAARVQQIAEDPGAEAQLPHDDRGPAVAEDFGRLGDGAELRIGDHRAILLRRPPPTSAFSGIAGYRRQNGTAIV